MLSQTFKQQSQPHNMERVAKSQNKRFVPKPGPVSLKKDVKQIATKTHPTRYEGDVFFVTKTLAEHNKMQGWAQ